jgi:Mg2+-importing ATPase
VLVTFAIRTRLRFWRSRPSGWLLWTSFAMAVVAFGLPFTSFGRRYFEFVALPWEVVGLVSLVLVAYFVAAEVAKHPFFRRLEL